MTTVFVTGATGFIAQHIVKELVAAGYTVIGTVRSPAKGDFLKSKLGEKFSYEIVSDIQLPGAFDDALKTHPEIKIILHTASPFTFAVEDYERDLLKPAHDGTMNILKSTKQFAPQVERFVITSSFAAILSLDKEKDPSVTYTEESWNDTTYETALLNPSNAYRASKTFAEKAAWEFIKTEKPNFALSTINPSFVFGPQAFDEQVSPTLNTSSEVINALVHSKLGEDYRKAEGSWVDVRDVAKAHVAAFEKEGAKNQRLLLAQPRFTEKNVLDVLNENFPALKGKIAVGVAGSDVENVANRAKVDASKTREILGFEWVDFKTSIIDSAKQIVEYDARQ